MTRGPLVVVGDALLDRDLEGRAGRLAPDTPVPVVDDPTERRRPGGAALAATLAARLDARAVVLVTALAGDEAGTALRELLELAGVEVVDLELAGRTPEKIRVRANGHSLLRLDRATRPGGVGPLGPAGRRALAGAGAVLVADYGRGVAGEPGVRAALAGLPRRRPLVWDPHPRGPAPVPGARLATPNRAEAAGFVPEVDGDDLAAVTARARQLAERWVAAGIAVTLGPRGALLVEGAAGGDESGGATSIRLGEASPSTDVGGSVVHSPPDSSPMARALGMIGAVRAGGGTVVATGGCFDLLHAGHVATLRAARALGDCLVVCLNSDDSVRWLKGLERPLVPEADRVAVLEALGCVDAVVPFDERTPEAVLQRLRPDVFAKGGDYALADLPEAALLATWGGQAVVLPYLEGRSTTQLMKEVVRRDSH
ncbi:MAG TPA: adenylyltransferase/cytidyltransferase family protein [Actinomycetota bacterium]|nr:adenylyltransferase/cytidyltransferase family protein [Actinomycetota bacterium]